MTTNNSYMRLAIALSLGENCEMLSEQSADSEQRFDTYDNPAGASALFRDTTFHCPRAYAQRRPRPRYSRRPWAARLYP